MPTPGNRGRLDDCSDNPYFAQVAVIESGPIYSESESSIRRRYASHQSSKNPELLAALAKFYRENGFRQKELLKTIMLSHVYSLSSQPNETNGSDHRNFSRHYRQRMRAEVLADAISDFTQIPLPIEDVPLGTKAVQLWTHRIEIRNFGCFGRPDANKIHPASD